MESFILVSQSAQLLHYAALLSGGLEEVNSSASCILAP